MEVAGGTAMDEPEHLLCPILQALYRDPVFVIDSGNTYERDAVLEFWERVGEARDPLTNVRLASREVRTNWGVRREVQGFLDRNPAYLPFGWDSRALLPPDRPPPPPPEPDRPPDVAEDDDPLLPAAARAHVAAVAQAHGGHLQDHLLQHFAGSLGVDLGRLREAFPPAAAAPGAAAPQLPPQDRAAAAALLPAAARAHCAAVAAAHGGMLPEGFIAPLASAFNVDAAALRNAFGAAIAAGADAG